MTLSPHERRRRVLIAVLLAGLAPPGGHLYLGRPRRGFAILAASLLAGLGWVLIVPRSLNQAQALGLAGALLILGLLVDSGLLARKSEEQLPPRRLHRWWVYLLLLVATQIVVPDLLFRLLQQRGGLALQGDASMEPVVLQGERVVFERLPPERAALRDALVVVEREDGDLTVRRVAALAGESVAIERGFVTIDGRAWTRDRPHRPRQDELALRQVTVAEGEVFLLAESRRSADPMQGPVPLQRVRGRANWVLQPPGFPGELRYGARLGMQLR